VPHSAVGNCKHKLKHCLASRSIERRLTIAENRKNANSGASMWLEELVAEETKVILSGLLFQDDFGMDTLPISHKTSCRDDYIGVFESFAWTVLRIFMVKLEDV
jgi:hypothetical protein